MIKHFTILISLTFIGNFEEKIYAAIFKSINREAVSFIPLFSLRTIPPYDQVLRTLHRFFLSLCKFGNNKPPLFSFCSFHSYFRQIFQSFSIPSILGRCSVIVKQQPKISTNAKNKPLARTTRHVKVEIVHK